MPSPSQRLANRKLNCFSSTHMRAIESSAVRTFSSHLFDWVQECGNRGVKPAPTTVRTQDETIRRFPKSIQAQFIVLVPEKVRTVFSSHMGECERQTARERSKGISDKILLRNGLGHRIRRFSPPSMWRIAPVE